MGVSVGLPHFLIVGACLFALGIITVVTRRNAVGILMGLELLLNAANLNFIAFNHFVDGGHLTGHVFSIFVIVPAEAHPAVGLSIQPAHVQAFKALYIGGHRHSHN